MKTAGYIDSVWAQAQIGARPALGAFWLTHAEIVPAEVQCENVRRMRERVPWMLAGTDFFDGSHIVC